MTDLKNLPGVNSKLFDNYVLLLKTLSGPELIKLTRPLLLFPGIQVHLKRHKRLKELANNGWLQIFKPETLIDLRLEFLTNTLEGMIKHIHSIIEYAIRKQDNDNLTNASTLGGSVLYIQGKIIKGKSFNNYPELNQLLSQFGRFQDLRNAVSHDQYMISIVYIKKTSTEIFEAADRLSENQESMKNYILKLPDDVRDNFLKIPAEIGKVIGLTPDSEPTNVLDGDNSFIVYESGNKWTPLKNNSPRMTVSDLTKKLNDFDQFFISTAFAIMHEIGERSTQGIIIERKCCDCGAPTFTLASINTFECWHCDKSN